VAVGRESGSSLFGVIECGISHRRRCYALLRKNRFFTAVTSPFVIGATDEAEEKAVEVTHPLKNAHTTILHLLWLDDNKLTYSAPGGSSN
jgi:hypothetical protein